MHALAPSTSLLFYETLQSRKQLTTHEKQRYDQLHKGFLGEKELENYIKQGPYHNFIALYDCLFSIGETETQIDCILLTADTIYLLEVKNYSGDYYIENNNLHYLPTKKQIYNPLTQLDRTEFFFKQILIDINVELPIRSFVIFINQNFMLYNASIHLPMIFSAQVERFLQKTNANTRPLNENTKILAKKILDKRIANSTFERRPDYDLSELKRGVFCQKCLTRLKRLNRAKFICPSCGDESRLKELILLSVAQYHILFPEEKITVRSIHDWCGGELSEELIYRTLNEQLSIIDKRKANHYEFNKNQNCLDILIKEYKHLTV